MIQTGRSGTAGSPHTCINSAVMIMSLKISLVSDTGDRARSSTKPVTTLTGSRIGTLFPTSRLLTSLIRPIDRLISFKGHQPSMPHSGFTNAGSLERKSNETTTCTVPGHERLTALFDLPWMPLYLIALFAFHDELGTAAVAGALAMVAIAIVAEVMTLRLTKMGNRAMASHTSMIQACRHNASLLECLGFASSKARWVVTYEHRPDGPYTVIHGSIEGDVEAQVVLSIKGTHDVADLHSNLQPRFGGVAGLPRYTQLNNKKR